MGSIGVAFDRGRGHVAGCEVPAAVGASVDLEEAGRALHVAALRRGEDDVYGGGAGGVDGDGGDSVAGGCAYRWRCTDAGAVGIADAHWNPLLGGLIPPVGVADVGTSVADGGVEWVKDHADHPTAAANADGLPLVAGSEIVGAGEYGGEKEKGESKESNESG